MNPSTDHDVAKLFWNSPTEIGHIFRTYHADLKSDNRYTISICALYHLRGIHSTGLWVPLSQGNLSDTLIDIMLDISIYEQGQWGLSSTSMLEGYTDTVYRCLIRCIRCFCGELVSGNKQNIEKAESVLKKLPKLWEFLWGTRILILKPERHIDVEICGVSIAEAEGHARLYETLPEDDEILDLDISFPGLVVTLIICSCRLHEYIYNKPPPSDCLIRELLLYIWHSDGPRDLLIETEPISVHAISCFKRINPGFCKLGSSSTPITFHNFSFNNLTFLFNRVWTSKIRLQHVVAYLATNLAVNHRIIDKHLENHLAFLIDLHSDRRLSGDMLFRENKNLDASAYICTFSAIMKALEKQICQGDESFQLQVMNVGFYFINYCLPFAKRDLLTTHPSLDALHYFYDTVMLPQTTARVSLMYSKSKEPVPEEWLAYLSTCLDLHRDLFKIYSDLIGFTGRYEPAVEVIKPLWLSTIRDLRACPVKSHDTGRRAILDQWLNFGDQMGWDEGKTEAGLPLLPNHATP
ncbi:hypothetical protein ABKN59_010086 [Abortiporus biennis]